MASLTFKEAKKIVNDHFEPIVLHWTKFAKLHRKSVKLYARVILKIKELQDKNGTANKISL